MGVTAKIFPVGDPGDYDAPENRELLVIAESLKTELEGRFPYLEFRILKLQAPGWEVRVFKAVSWAGLFVKGMLKVTREGLLAMTQDEGVAGGCTIQHLRVDYADPRLVDLVCSWVMERAE